MKKEYQQIIINQCPNLFAKLNEQPGGYVLPIYFGIECGDGWFDLIKDLCIKIESIINKLPEERQKFTHASQIKEKFGLLRFYMSNYIKEIDEEIDKAEELSGKICETCGKPGKLYVRGGHWVYTSCGEHAGDGEPATYVDDDEFPTGN